jgi:hypothetical protein
MGPSLGCRLPLRPQPLRKRWVIAEGKPYCRGSSTNRTMRARTSSTTGCNSGPNAAASLGRRTYGDLALRGNRLKLTTPGERMEQDRG